MARLDADPLVCVVDDDDGFRDSLCVLLEAAGFSVQAYASAEAFLRGAHCARCQCLLVDVRMAGMTGLELQERLAAAGSDIPVIVMTGHADVPTAVRALKAGAADFIEKPFDDETLLEGVRRAVERRRRMQDRIAERQAAAALYATLTPREREVMAELLAGRQTKIIAFELGLSPRTVEVHRARIMQKMQARNLSQLIRMALETGIGPGPG